MGRSTGGSTEISFVCVNVLINVNKADERGTGREIKRGVAGQDKTAFACGHRHVDVCAVES